MIEVTRVVTIQLTQITTIEDWQAEQVAERSGEDVKDFAGRLKHDTDSDDVIGSYQIFMREVGRNGRSN